MKQIAPLFVSANILAWALLGCMTGAMQASNAHMERPANWAVPVAIEGAPNCYKVANFLYRGAQPTREGLQHLRAMGVKTIINLRGYDSDTPLINGIGFHYYHIPTDTTMPERAKYQKVLDIVSNPELQPVFVHCFHGADRTGTAVALYRIGLEEWHAEEAINEMLQGGYGYHSIFQENIRFIRNFDNKR